MRVDSSALAVTVLRCLLYAAELSETSGGAHTRLLGPSAAEEAELYLPVEAVEAVGKAIQESQLISAFPLSLGTST